MVDRSHAEETLVEDMDQERQTEERLRWVNARMREANAADLIEDIDIIEDEDDAPIVR